MKYTEKMIKESLDLIIENMSKNKELFVKNPEKDFIRNRKIGFEDTIKLILAMKGNTLNKELYEFYGKDPESLVTSSAFVQQRDKLKEGTFEYLFQTFNENMDDNKSFKGYKLYAVDGSDISAFYDPNVDTYVQPAIKIKKDGTEGRGHNAIHLNAIYDLLNKVYVNATLQTRKNYDERRAFIDMVENTDHYVKTLYIADRGYPSWNVFTHFKYMNNADFLICYPNEKSNLTRNLPMCQLDIDKTVVLTTKPLNKMPKDRSKQYFHIQARKKDKDYSDKTSQTEWDFGDREEITLRIVRFKITDTTFETIITSLPRKEFPMDVIKKLYGMRWGIETSFRELKYIIGLINLHSKKEEFVRQEIFARLTMYNFCERIMSLVVVKQDEGKKYQYQVNFTMGMQICIDFFKAFIDIENLFSLILRYILPIKPGRKDKRKAHKSKDFVGFMYRVA